MGKKRKITAIDLFCGAGGLTHGLVEAGIEVKAGIDIDTACSFPYEHNNQNAEFILKDIRNIESTDLLKIWGNCSTRLLAGCAPCQPFSTYRQSKNSQKDARYELLDEFSRLARGTLPEFVTMENVPTLAKQPIFFAFINDLHTLGYEVSHRIVNCKDYGVPQGRKRLVVIASRIGAVLDISELVSPEITVEEAIGDLPRIKAGEIHIKDALHRAAKLSNANQKRIQNSKPGGTWRDWPDSLRLPCHKKVSGKGYTPVYGRMQWDTPAPTLTTQCYNYGSGRYGHPEQDRAISLREAAILQSFPRDYTFVESGKSVNLRELGRIIGNAVPVELGRRIGMTIQNSLAAVI